MVFRILLAYLVLMGAIMPVSYVMLVNALLTDGYFTLDLVSDDAIYWGNVYTLLGTIIFLFAALTAVPAKLNQAQIQSHNNVYRRYSSVLFAAACIASLISLSLSLIYGMVQSGLTPQRPAVAVYAAYVSRVFYMAGPIYLGYQLILFGRLTQRGWLIVFLMLADLAAAWSRSGLVNLLFVFLLSLAYSSEGPKVKLAHLFSFFILGTVSVFVGQYLRMGQTVSALSEALLRFYANNQALYLAMADHNKIYSILTEGQPWVVIDQLFSFAVERTRMPSSFRLAEYWGEGPVIDERDHIVGYAYGWLGLTYGAFKWWGLVVLYFVFTLAFRVLGKCIQKPGLMNISLFFYTGMMLLEFFGNLGFDSFFEKLFKSYLGILLFVVLVKLAELGVMKPSSNATSLAGS